MLRPLRYNILHPQKIAFAYRMVLKESEHVKTLFEALALATARPREGFNHNFPVPGTRISPATILASSAWTSTSHLRGEEGLSTIRRGARLREKPNAQKSLSSLRRYIEFCTQLYKLYLYSPYLLYDFNFIFTSCLHIYAAGAKTERVVVHIS